MDALETLEIAIESLVTSTNKLSQSPYNSNDQEQLRKNVETIAFSCSTYEHMNIKRKEFERELAKRKPFRTPDEIAKYVREISSLLEPISAVFDTNTENPS